MLATAAVAASSTVALAASKGDPLVVSQLDSNVSMTLGRREHGHFQKLAQTFVAPKTARKLASVSLVLAAEDKEAVVKVYEVGKKPPFGTLLAKVTIPVDAQWDGSIEWQKARMRPAITVTPGERYSLVVKPVGRRTRMGAAGGVGGYGRGQHWCYCPGWDGEIDWENARWQSAEELDSPMMDLMFKLRFWRG